MAAAAFVNFEIFTATRPRLGFEGTNRTDFEKTKSAGLSSELDQGTAAGRLGLSGRGRRLAGCSERT